LIAVVIIYLIFNLADHFNKSRIIIQLPFHKYLSHLLVLQNSVSGALQLTKATIEQRWN